MTSPDLRVVTLRLADDLFAIEARQVREIIDPTAVTRAPNASPFAPGLINVRGAVAPLVDLRVPLGLERRTESRDARIVVLEIELDGEVLVAGLLADKVHDIADVPAAAIEPPPRIGTRWPPDFVRGIGRMDGEFFAFPDLEKIFLAHGGARTPAGAL